MVTHEPLQVTAPLRGWVCLYVVLDEHDPQDSHLPQNSGSLITRAYYDPNLPSIIFSIYCLYSGKLMTSPFTHVFDGGSDALPPP